MAWVSTSHFSFPSTILPWLSIGGNMFTDDIVLWLEYNGYTHVINASNTRDGYLPRQSNINYMELPFEDLPSFNIGPWLESVAREIDKIYSEYTTKSRFQQHHPEVNLPRVLVHCQAGISRSVTLVTYWLITRKGLSFDQALNYIRNNRKIANPNQGFQWTLKNL